MLGSRASLRHVPYQLELGFGSGFGFRLGLIRARVRVRVRVTLTSGTYSIRRLTRWTPSVSSTAPVSSGGPEIAGEIAPG